LANAAYRLICSHLHELWEQKHHNLSDRKGLHMLRRGRNLLVIAVLSAAAVTNLHATDAPIKVRSPERAGLVRWKNEWLSPEQIAEKAKTDSLLAEYNNRRKVVEENVASQFKLANWCQQKELVDQERTHLTKVLDLEPDNADARARLGFRLIDGQWLSSQEIQGAKQRAKLASLAVGRYAKPLRAIVASLASNDEKVQSAGKARLMEIQDPAAIPLMEAALKDKEDPIGLAFVDALSAMSSPEASIALSRIAVSTPSRDVRDAAIEKLKSAKPEFFVPSLMASLSKPVANRIGIFESLDGRLIYRHIFSSEGAASRQVAVLDQVFRTPSGARVNDGTVLAERVGEVAVSAAQANDRIEDTNQRIFKLLSAVSGVELPAKPEVWWSWWNDVTETALAEEKPVYRKYVTREYVTRNAPERPNYTLGAPERVTVPRLHECLVAGTTVWTLTGPQAIETIQAGDLVLAKNPATDELAYKPVLRPTVRPEVPLVTIRLPNETITASGGHLFWTVDNGWQRARQLQTGMSLVLLSGAAEIQAVEEAKPEQTYNLIVADFHTYFVGPSRVLSHDNTLRQPAAETARVAGGMKVSKN
jgi:hypothetical protein